MSNPFTRASRGPSNALGVTLSMALIAASPGTGWAAESKTPEKTAPTPATTTRTGFFSRSKPVEPTPEKAPEKTASKPSEKTSEKAQDKSVQKSAESSTPSAASTAPKKTSTQTSTAAPKSSPKAAPANEDELFAQARRQASEDAKVAELRIKADEAKSKDAANAATKAYLKSLYSKMRSIEPSLKDRIDLTEAAALKGLDSPK